MDITEYVAAIEGTCGEEKDIVVTFKHSRRDEIISRIKTKAKLRHSLAGIIFEMAFQDYSFRLYSSGKAIFRDIRSKEELKDLLANLLS